MIDGSPKTGRLPDILSADGFHRIYDNNWLSGKSQELRGHLESLHSLTDENSGIFGNKWSQSFIDIWNKTDALVDSIRGVKTLTTFTTRLDTAGISSSLKQVSRLIQIRNERGAGINREVFHVQQGGYDGHFDVALNLETRLPSLNHAGEYLYSATKASTSHLCIAIYILTPCSFISLCSWKLLVRDQSIRDRESSYCVDRE